MEINNIPHGWIAYSFQCHLTLQTQSPGHRCCNLILTRWFVKNKEEEMKKKTEKTGTSVHPECADQMLFRKRPPKKNNLPWQRKHVAITARMHPDILKQLAIP